MRGLFIFLLVLVGCSEKKEATTNLKSEEQISANTKDTITGEPVFYSQFILNQQGQITDSFPHAQPYFSRIKTNAKQEFPSGFAAFQQPLCDTLLCGCEHNTTYFSEWVVNDDTTYGKKPEKMVEKFKATEGKSVFTKDNITNYFFFLTQIDSSDLFIHDSQYGLLHFLKLKTVKQGLKFNTRYYKEEYVNQCAIMRVSWQKPFSYYIMEDGKNYTSNISEWTEAWECNQKADYAPVYPFLNPKQVNGLQKVYTGDKEDLFARWITNPTFVFSYICFDDQKNEWATIKSASYDMQLVTIAGKVRKGRGLDFNGDKKADVFWYNLVYNEDVSPERLTVLYLKIEGEWVPVYHLFKNEFI